jgi:predicted dehydrogenase
MGILKWALIGCGDIAQKRVAPALRDLPTCELVTVCRARPELAESFAKQFGAKRWAVSWPEAVAAEDIGAVYVATPVDLHAEQTITAAEAGKHVLCEKPMALNVQQCDRMIAACRANHVKLGIAYYRHFYPVIGRIKGLIRSGEIGEPVLAQVNAFEPFNPPPGDPRHWFVEKRRSGGGPMFDFGCHRIEVLVHILGPIVQTESLVSTVVHKREVEDTATALFRFARGACGVLTVTHAAGERQDTLDIFGTAGSIHVPVLNEGRLEIKKANHCRVEIHPAAANIHQPLIEDFVEAVLADRGPRVNGEIGRMVAAIEEAIYAQQ